MNTKKRIFVTKYDYDRLVGVIEKYGSAGKANANIRDLTGELRRARKLDSKAIPPEYVTMNSIFELKDLGEPNSRELKLVFPDEADIEKNRISVLAPIGTAVLGYKVGDVIKWNTPSGEKYFQISRIIYQPEANGDYHL